MALPGHLLSPIAPWSRSRAPPGGPGRFTPDQAPWAGFTPGSLDVALEADVVRVVPRNLPAEKEIVHGRLVVRVVAGRGLHSGLRRDGPGGDVSRAVVVEDANRSQWGGLPLGEGGTVTGGGSVVRVLGVVER